MNHKRLTLLFIFFLLLFMLFTGCAKEEVSQIILPEGKTAKIVFLVGDVFKTEDNEWVQAAVGDVLTEGTWLKTEDNSYCEIVISSGTLFRMKDKSELLIALLPADEKDNNSLIKLIKGELFAKIQKIAYKSSESVETESVTLGVRGTEFLVYTGDALSSQRTEVLVADGVVNVRMNVKEFPRYEIPRGLRPIVRKVEKGVNVRGGNRIEVSIKKVERLNETIEGIVERKVVTDAELTMLRQEVILKPLPMDENDIKRVEELKGLSLNYQQGETYYLSPNFDGENDEFEFSTAGFADEKIHGWKLVILNGDLDVEKVIKHRISDENNYVELPETITWNMVSEDGNIVIDGNYVYEFYTSNKNGEYILRVRGVIVVDTVPPYLDISAQDTTFSPNEDNVKDTIKIDIKAEKDVDWVCTITTPEGIAVKTKEWGTAIPEVFEWDGKGENGNILPEGVYNIAISGKDIAGNITTMMIKEISLDVRERRASVDIDNPIFSPNGDGVFDTVTFKPVLSDRSRIDTWDLIVQTDKGDTARRFRGVRYIPEKVVWDGKPQKGKSYEKLPKELPSGEYYYFLKVIYRSGINTYSFKKELVLDIDPPEIDVQITPSVFSPDGDGKDDTLFIKPVITDLSPIEGWKATIFTSQDTVFKTFSGYKMLKDEIVWDGVSDTGKLVDSGEEYYLVMQVTDSVNNTGVSSEMPFSIDILVIPTERGLKIQVSNIEFGFAAANLQGEKTFKILDKIIRVLKKYEKYSITIEGHTDSTGDESFNLKLSKQRAEAVGEYLVKSGVDAERLSYEGYGSQFPIDTNETKEGRARNRRVEFLLIRK